MSRTKGIQKTGGRAKGTPNKMTTEVKAWLAGLIDKNRRQIERDLEQLEPKDRILMLEKLMQYVIPKMQSVDARVDLNSLTDEQLDAVVTELARRVENG
jgi:hypothetical protein